MPQSDVSRFVLSEASDISILLFGREWLEQPQGKGRTLLDSQLDELMTEAEFLENSLRTT